MTNNNKKMYGHMYVRKREHEKSRKIRILIKKEGKG